MFILQKNNQIIFSNLNRTHELLISTRFAFISSQALTHNQLLPKRGVYIAIISNLQKNYMIADSVSIIYEPLALLLISISTARFIEH